MKKISEVLGTILFIFTVSSVVPQAWALTVLEHDGQTVVFDEQHQKYWYRDINAFTDKTYAEQQQQIANLNAEGYYFGKRNWGMATYDDMLALWQYNDAEAIATAFTRTLVSMFTTWWKGRYDTEALPEYSFTTHYTATVIAYRVDGVPPWEKLPLATETVHDTSRTNRLGAWVIAGPGSQSDPVPEPATLTLLGVGLLGLVALGKKKLSRK